MQKVPLDCPFMRRGEVAPSAWERRWRRRAGLLMKALMPGLPFLMPGGEGCWASTGSLIHEREQRDAR